MIGGRSAQRGDPGMSMNMDVYTTVHEERLKEFQNKVEQERLARGLPRRSQTLGRRVAGRLGSMMITTGYRLERIERGGRPVVCDL